jgi:hypothetical protein
VKIILILLLLSSNLVFSQDCPEGTWNRNQYTGPGGGLYTGPGGGLYTGPGGGMYTGPGGGLYTGPSQYCGNRPPLSYLRRKGIID